MKTNDEILKHDQGMTKEGIHDRLSMGRRDLLILEILIDIMEIINVRLSAIEETILKYVKH